MDSGNIKSLLQTLGNIEHSKTRKHLQAAKYRLFKSPKLEFRQFAAKLEAKNKAVHGHNFAPQ